MDKNESVQRDTIIDEEEILYQEFLKRERRCDSIRDLNRKKFKNRNSTLRNVLKNNQSNGYSNNKSFLFSLLNFIEDKETTPPIFAVNENELVTMGALTIESDLKKYKSLIDSLHSYSTNTAITELNETSFEIYLYGIEKTKKSYISSLNLKFSEMCGEVYLSYPFEGDSTTYHVASRFPLSLSYTDFSETNKILLNNFEIRNQCSAPYSRNGQWKVFAKVKGYPNLFFCYSVNDELNHKALIYIDNQNQIHELWNDSKYDGNC